MHNLLYVSTLLEFHYQGILVSVEFVSELVHNVKHSHLLTRIFVCMYVCVCVWGGGVVTTT